jgi:hypothetical protein
VIIIILLVIGLAVPLIFIKDEDPRIATSISQRYVSYTVVKNSLVYAEYEFDGKINPDSGSYDMLKTIEKDKTTFHGSDKVLPDDEMDYVELTETDKQKGVIQKYTAGTDVYELRGGGFGTWYSIYKNGDLLFKRNMEYGADGPVIDWRIVEGKPAFTLRTSCPVINSVQTCISDIFYGGQFINEKYNVEDARYLFAYDGKIGFVAKDPDGKDRIFFDGTFITEPFDTIHAHNCCSIQQILPTVYENGVLLFYGSRDEKDYLAEVKL